jgi:ubiquinone/menaquinone biosynthesis C-methylase UbiE
VSEEQKLDVDDAYALETPEDSVRLYGEWAKTYDANFVASSGYVIHLRVAEQLIEYRSSIDGIVLDVGCGTGIVGARLREGGIGAIDGIDISKPMLAEAGKKKTLGGLPVYRNLIAADLTKKLDIPDDQYAGLISAGTFTHGHLGPDSLNELWRVAAPGACCAIGVRTTHFEAMDFAAKLSIDVEKNIITPPDLVEVNLYCAEASSPEHANDKALIVICRVLR